MTTRLIFFLLFCLNTIFAYAGDKDSKITYFDKNLGKLKIFMEGSLYDYNYIRETVKFVDFVSDPTQCDVHIIMRSQATGGGGKSFSIRFINKSIKEIGDMTLYAESLAGDTNDEIRNAIVQTVKLGLMPFISKTNEVGRINISMDKGNNDTTTENNLEQEDPWNAWVFTIDANGNFNIEESKDSYSYSGRIKANRVTEKHRFRTTLYAKEKNRRYKQDDESWTEYNNENGYANFSYAYSLTDHWSLGGYAYSEYSTYKNMDISGTSKLSLEYNFFSWADYNKRIFTIAYHLGPEYSDYTVLTIYEKTSDFYLEQRINANLNLIETWGEFQTSIGGEGDVTDLSKYNVSISSDLSLRIARGLSVTLGLDAEKIHNQLYLPMGNYTQEDILLGNVKLPSTYEVSGNIGVRFQFGSIYNNVVNMRL